MERKQYHVLPLELQHTPATMCFMGMYLGNETKACVSPTCNLFYDNFHLDLKLQKWNGNFLLTATVTYFTSISTLT